MLENGLCYGRIKEMKSIAVQLYESCKFWDQDIQGSLAGGLCFRDFEHCNLSRPFNDNAYFRHRSNFRPPLDFGICMAVRTLACSRPQVVAENLYNKPSGLYTLYSLLLPFFSVFKAFFDAYWTSDHRVRSPGAALPTHFPSVMPHLHPETHLP